MSVQRVRAGDVLRLERTPVELDPAHEFVTIGVRSFGKGIFHYDAKPGDQLGKLRFFALEPRELGRRVVREARARADARALPRRARRRGARECRGEHRGRARQYTGRELTFRS